MKPRPKRSYVPMCAALLVLAGAAPRGSSQPSTSDPNLISLEVAALQTLDQLDLRPPQLRALREMARTAGDTGRKRQAARASAEYRKALLALHEALRKGDEKAEELEQDLQTIAEKEEAELDTDYDLTDAARVKAPALLNMLSPAQVTTIISVGVTDSLDLVATLAEAVEEGRQANPAEWKEVRDEAAEEVARLLAGLDPSRVRETATRLEGLLDKLHRMPGGSPMTPRAQLETEVRELMGQAGAFGVIRHSVEYYLADLLSNPGLNAAIQARLQPAR